MSRTPRLGVAAAVVLFAALAPAGLRGQQPAPSAPPPGSAHPPLPKPVNLKVLPKDTTPEQLMKIMHGYSQQLGVHCNFCHVIDETTHHPDFASDEKPEKNTARTMISMTDEIDAKYLSEIHDPDAAPDQKTVTCGTCHQGHSMPIPFKPPPGHASTPKPQGN